MKFYTSNIALNKKLIVLVGFMGAGKTSLVKGIAKDLGIKEPITSPTFALSQHYLTGKRALIHLDLYRLENQQSAYDLFLQEEEEATSLKGLLVVEWASHLGKRFEDALHVKLQYWKNQQRLIQLRLSDEEDKKAST